MTIVQAGLLADISGPLPRRRAFDLLSTVEFVDADFHARAGVQIWPYPPALPGVHNPCSEATGSSGLKDEGEPTAAVDFGGFTVYLPITCTTRGMGEWEEFKRRAVVAMEARESYAVELELARDVAGIGNPHLTQGGITPLSGAAVSSSEGLALLENAIASETAQAGMIHADPATVTAWARDFLVYKENDALVTTNGTRVAAGAGYVGIHPSDESAPPADGAWAFATGFVQVVRSDIYGIPDEVKEAVDRTFNVVTFRAERDYVAGWDGSFLAEVLIDRSI